MTDLTQFNFHGNGVRAIQTPTGDVEFIAKDVLAVLDLNRSSLVALDDDEKGVHSMYTPGGQQPVATVTEPGLYSLVFRSRKSEAREFKRWITHEVLPSIRKTGAYGTPQLTGRELMAHALIEAQATIEAEQKRIAELEPPAHSWNTLVEDTGGDWTMRDAAQILARDPEIEIGQNRLAKLLREIRWIDRRGIPLQVQIDNGRLMAKPQTRVSHRTGERVACDPQVRITLKGLSWLHQHLGGVAPLETDTPHLTSVS